jgi:hypothetical protein
MTVMTIICSKLSSWGDDNHIVRTPDKDRALHRSSKDKAILAIIDIDIGCDIKDEIGSIFAIIDIELLSFKWIDGFNFKLISLVFKVVVLEIFFFFLYWTI